MLTISPLPTIKVSATTIAGPFVSSSPTTEVINKMIFANGKYYIVGGDENDGKKAVIYSSLDAITWQAISIANCSDGTLSSDLDSIRDIQYANGVFVAVGKSASTLGVTMAVSTDGVTWKAIREANSNLYSVTFSGYYGLWATSGYNTSLGGVIYASFDNGVSWYNTGAGGGNGIVFADDESNPDPLFWTVGGMRDHPTEQRMTSDINYANAGELDGWYYFENDVEDLTSIDYINGWLMAVSDSNLYLKGDDYFYYRVLTGVTGTVGHFSKITYVNGQYVIPAGKWDGSKWNAIAIVSSDLENWQAVTIDTRGGSLTSVVYNAGEYKMTDSIGNVYSTSFIPSVPPTIKQDNPVVIPISVESATNGNKNIGQALSTYKALLTKVDNTNSNKPLSRLNALLLQIGSFSTYKPSLLAGTNQLK